MQTHNQPQQTLSPEGAFHHALARAQAEPSNADAQFWLAIYAAETGRKDLAAQAYTQAILLNPYSPQTHYNFAVTLGQLGRDEESVLRYQDCLRLNPNHADALWNLSEQLRIRNQFRAALVCFETILALKAYYPGLYQRMACTYFGLGDYAKADEYFTLESHDPLDRDLLMWEWYHTRMASGRHALAWAAYAHRFAVGHKVNVHCHPFPQPHWRGEPLAGKTILLHGEQGLGDEIMFCSIVRDVQALGAQVLLAIRPSLMTLMSQSMPGVQVLAHTVGGAVADVSKFPSIDFQIPLGSLGAQLRQTQAQFDAAKQPYLVADIGMTNGFKQLLNHHANKPPANRKKLAVGMAWASNPITKSAKMRSLDIHTVNQGLSGLSGVQWVSLLNRDVGAQAADAPLLDMIDLSYALTDFSVTAALIAALDLVVTVDTSVAHVAGALGKQTWLLTPNPADCRWGNMCEANPWYASVRVMRQPSDGSGWAGLLRQVKQELLELTVSA